MLALICGTGSLPLAISSAQDTPPLICVLDGFAPEHLEPDMTFRLETLGGLLNTLKERGVRDICLCGAITRPAIDPSAIDAATLPLIPALQAAMAQGDDGALRAVMTVFEDMGFTIRGAAELAPAILPEAGVLTTAQPGLRARADVQEARLALADMGRRDLGQACIVRDAQVIAREDDRGTDAMLTDLAQGHVQPSHTDVFGQVVVATADVLDGVADWLSGLDLRNQQGLLYKGPKPGQDRRADLPTIGPSTAIGAAKAGLSGIVVEAGGVIVLERDTVIHILNQAEMFLWVRTP